MGTAGSRARARAGPGRDRLSNDAEGQTDGRMDGRTDERYGEIRSEER